MTNGPLQWFHLVSGWSSKAYRLSVKMLRAADRRPALSSFSLRGLSATTRTVHLETSYGLHWSPAPRASCGHAISLRC